MCFKLIYLLGDRKLHLLLLKVLSDKCLWAWLSCQQKREMVCCQFTAHRPSPGPQTTQLLGDKNNLKWCASARLAMCRLNLCVLLTQCGTQREAHTPVVKRLSGPLCPLSALHTDWGYVWWPLHISSVINISKSYFQFELYGVSISGDETVFSAAAPFCNLGR